MIYPTNAELIAQIKDVITDDNSTALLELLLGLQPFDIAEVLEELDLDEQIAVIKAIPAKATAEALVHLEPIEQYRTLDHLDQATSKQILNDVSSDDVVDLLIALHPRQAERLLKWLPDEYEKKIRSLMSYPENTAGSLAAIDYVAARQSWTADQTLAHVRRVGSEAEIISYIYVLDPAGRLVGVTSLRELILVSPQTKLEEFCNRSVISVPAEADQEDAALILSQYDLVALPVLGKNGRMVGIITVDDIIDVIEEETTEDFHKVAAVLPLKDSYNDSGVWPLFRKRIGWLVLLVFINLVSSGVIAAFEETLATAIALTFFIPLLIGSGGNAGAQSATLMVRSLATGDTQQSNWGKVVVKELGVGLFLGATMGLAGWGLGLLRGGFEIGVIVSLSMVTIVTVANIIGVTLPFILTRFRQDPAVASGPLITTVVDASGLLIYFSIARIVLRAL